MGRLLACAARFLASAAFCRYSSDLDDMQGEHWKDASARPGLSLSLCGSAGTEQGGTRQVSVPMRLDGGEDGISWQWLCHCHVPLPRGLP